MTLGIPKSVITRVKTTNAALITPYFAEGRVTVKKVRIDFDRNTFAASYNLASPIDKAVIIISRACGNV